MFVSEKRNLKRCNKLKLDKSYILIEEIIEGIDLGSQHIDAQMVYGDEFIKFDNSPNVVRSIFTSPNIEDVCYVK
jgi:hypothetical protein